MKGRKWFSGIAATVLATGVAVAGLSLSSWAQQLRNNQVLQGVIDNGSPIYRFRDMWTPGTPTRELRGQEYNFTAQEGDQLQVNVDVNRSYGFSPVLVLFYSDNNKQVAFSQNSVFSYQIPRSGNYRLLVLAKDASTPKGYGLAIYGISEEGARRPGGLRNRDYDRDRDY
ncbi:MAG: hypothetical protein ACM37W_28355, partial [Actinomycetota bacterium]